MRDTILAHLERHEHVLSFVKDSLLEPIQACAAEIVRTFSAGRKVLVVGNGGSAADAQHFAAELVGRYLQEREPLPALALTTDTSALTAISNDYGFEEVFSRQVRAFGIPGDLVMGISTSGNSKNVHNALVAARQMGCRTIGLLGNDGGTIRDVVDLALVVPVKETPHIQEAHITMIHILCDLVEKGLAGQFDG